MLQTFKTRLSTVQPLAPNVFLYDFALLEQAEVKFFAGQYMILLVPQQNGSPARRLYSVASPVQQSNSFSLVVQLVEGGLASSYLQTLRVGSEVGFQGPAGMFTLRESTREKIFLITGTGIAPVLSMLGTETGLAGSSALLFWGLPTLKDVYLAEKLKGFTIRLPGFSYTICVSREQSLDAVNEQDRSHYALGRITVGFEQYMQNNHRRASEFDYYLCGSRQVVESLRVFLAEKQIPKEQVFFEKF